MKPSRLKAAVRLAGAATVLAIVACAEETPPPPPPSAIPAGASIGSGAILGRVTFTGEAPPPEVVSMSSDPVCRARGAGQTREDVVVNSDGTLRNVFVRIASGLGDRVFAPPSEPAVLDQKGCTYRPHVLGVQVHQILEVINSDPTLHNIHSVPERNRPFNVGMPAEGMRIRKFFTVPEVMVRVKCDLHNWMTAWVGVLDHPFFDVTGDGGAFSLEGLPAGDYVVEARHEVFGTLEAPVSLADGERKEIAFDYRPNAL